MLRIAGILWTEEAEEHIWERHRVTPQDAEEATHNSRLITRGKEKGIYEVYGQTDAGAYLMVFIRLLPKYYARIITARPMTDSEKRRYKGRLWN
jgi:uncharacterized DUF497 family protein